MVMIEWLRSVPFTASDEICSLGEVREVGFRK